MHELESVELGGPPGGAVAVWRAVVRVLRSSADDVSAVVFPSDCRVCDGPLTRLSRVPVCDGCLSLIVPQKFLLCDCCGEAVDMESVRFAASEAAGRAPIFGGEMRERMCAPCRMVAPDFVKAVAFGVYEGALREMVHLLKFERAEELAGPLGGKLAEAVELMGAECPREMLVVAVPLFKKKGRERGLNQAVLLADSAVRVLNARGWKLMTAHGAMMRVRETASQFALTPKQRRVNLRGAFEVRSEMVAGKDVLIVDDIYTTGATARECSRVMMRTGAKSVRVATLARAQRDVAVAWDGAVGEPGVRVGFGG